MSKLSKNLFSIFSPMMFFSQLIAIMARNLEIFENSTLFEALEDIPEDDDETHLNDDFSEKD